MHREQSTLIEWAVNRVTGQDLNPDLQQQSRGRETHEVRLNPVGQTWIASLPEKEAVGIQWERLWGPDSNTSPGTESLRNLDQSLPLFGTQFSHLQNERVGSYEATSSQQQQPWFPCNQRQGQEKGGVETLTPKVLGKPGSGWDGQREPARGAVPTILSAAAKCRVTRPPPPGSRSGCLNH